MKKTFIKLSILIIASQMLSSCIFLAAGAGAAGGYEYAKQKGKTK